MPIASAIDWLSLDRAKAQLRAEPTDNELTDIVNASVAWVEERLQHPIIDSTYRLIVPRPGTDYAPFYALPYFATPSMPYDVRFVYDKEDSPIQLRGRGLRGAPVITYWEPSQSVTESPTGTAAASRIDNGEGYARASVTTALYNDPCLYPPTGGWPEVLQGTPLVVTGSAGFDAVGDIPPQWLMAALQIVSALYESPELEPKFRNTANRLLAPYLRLGM